MFVGAGPAHAMYFAGYEKIKRELTWKLTKGKPGESPMANALAGMRPVIFLLYFSLVIKKLLRLIGVLGRMCSLRRVLFQLSYFFYTLKVVARLYYTMP